MPLYDFRCVHCEKTFEAMSKPEGAAPCPDCGLLTSERAFPLTGTYFWNCDAGASTKPKRIQRSGDGS